MSRKKKVLTEAEIAATLVAQRAERMAFVRAAAEMYENLADGYRELERDIEEWERDPFDCLFPLSAREEQVERFVEELFMHEDDAGWTVVWRDLTDEERAERKRQFEEMVAQLQAMDAELKKSLERAARTAKKSTARKLTVVKE